MTIFEFARKMERDLIIQGGKSCCKSDGGIDPEIRFVCYFEDRGMKQNTVFWDDNSKDWKNLPMGRGKTLDAAVRNYIKNLQRKRIGFVNRYAKIEAFDVPHDLTPGSYS